MNITYVETINESTNLFDFLWLFEQSTPHATLENMYTLVKQKKMCKPQTLHISYSNIQQFVKRNKDSP
jgi:hypothetical protein